MFGIDISSYQKGIDLPAFDFDFAIVKATEGTNYTSSTLKTFTEQLTGMNKLIGFYHFARPTKEPTISRMIEEASHFIDTIADLNMIGKAILCLDWEVEPFNRPDLIYQWMEIVQNETGATPFIYGSKSKLNSGTFNNLIRDYPVWLAQYPHITKNVWNDRERYVKANVHKTVPMKFDIWQYTSTGIVPGYNGNVDLNYTEMSVKQWKEYAGTIEKVEEEISDDMRWAIKNGLFVGYGNGKYGPKDYLTREQLATVLHKFSDIILSQVNNIIDNQF